MKQIESKENQRFKGLLRIKKSGSKENGARVFIEGFRLCKDALISGVVIETMIFSTSTFSEFGINQFNEVSDVLVLSDNLFNKLCSTKVPQGIAAIVISPVIYYNENFKVNTDDKFIICESVQDPGNFGSIIRSADAFGFSGVIFTSDTVDPFNEKTMRSSMGSVFHINLFCTDDILKTITFLKMNGVSIYAAHLEGTDLSEDFRFTSPFAIIVGNEGNGIKDETSVLCNQLIRIPMTGKAESLNVSNATAIMCYHASIFYNK